jgi:hypothetical protein
VQVGSGTSIRSVTPKSRYTAHKNRSLFIFKYYFEVRGMLERYAKKASYPGPALLEPRVKLNDFPL